MEIDKGKNARNLVDYMHNLMGSAFRYIHPAESIGYIPPDFKFDNSFDEIKKSREKEFIENLDKAMSFLKEHRVLFPETIIDMCLELIKEIKFIIGNIFIDGFNINNLNLFDVKCEQKFKEILEELRIFIHEEYMPPRVREVERNILSEISKKTFYENYAFKKVMDIIEANYPNLTFIRKEKSTTYADLYLFRVEPRNFRNPLPNHKEQNLHIEQLIQVIQRDGGILEIKNTKITGDGNIITDGNENNVINESQDASLISESEDASSKGGDHSRGSKNTGCNVSFVIAFIFVIALTSILALIPIAIKLITGS